ncbi:mycofactocin oligosaccharide methyltransferase MftM [Tsukamurella sp. 8F]|uniref:mycofactocin oligosaccharide methyltransferase MftM n=1 Tax=unclassified Tsukamurella TaxID=2633480 RepID=UPI0023B9CC27|nr:MULTISPECIES: mycofactocin oligosaccharide methyltransferase MftM [unclassified Tsukamurella]MDF0530831.1 mycofactocin oligosaccharide methyltransferase MftM [Tsukamurella sp. 8J]MDF0588224.1 mycofactocin oligosaccharide methyltransferase MftM [Tsukamurella sp. 8F]
MIATLAPTASGQWADGDTEVIRLPAGARAGAMRMNKRPTGVRVRHALRPADLSDDLAGRIIDELGPDTADQFERIIVGLVRTTVDDPYEGWATYYRNSLRRLADGSAAFAPVHARAAELQAGDSLLDLGSCFGFYALRMAARGLRVTATDVCPGTVRLLRTVAERLGTRIDAQVHDATHVDLPDNHSDTVTVLHLLEHLDPEAGAAVVREAVRLARTRVVIAVPFEDQATTCHRHVRTFDLDTLEQIGTQTRLPHSIFEHHGGWLVLDLPPV